MGHAWLRGVAWLAGATGAAVVGLAAVSAVRDYVADAPVQVLSLGDIDRILGEPSASLAPILTVAASESAPSSRPTPRVSASRTQPVGVNADDRPYSGRGGAVSAQGSGGSAADVGTTGAQGATGAGVTGTMGATGAGGRVAASTQDPTVPTPSPSATAATPGPSESGSGTTSGAASSTPDGASPGAGAQGTGATEAGSSPSP